MLREKILEAYKKEGRAMRPSEAAKLAGDYIGLVERQGRYYRRATEILGFTRSTPHRNISRLTDKGRNLLAAPPDQRRKILTVSVLGVSSVQNVVGMLTSSKGAVPLDRIESAIRVLANTTHGMAERRLKTILSWLDDLNITTREDSSVKLLNLPSSVENIEITDPDVPVLPRPSDLKLFTETSNRLRKARGLIRVEVDAAAIERANMKHEKLRSLLSRKIKKCGSYPTYNRFIDLAARISNEDFIIEVKSSGKSIHSQVRRGISQLYEYRYLQGLPEAKLVLCLENPLSGNYAWLLNYIIEDRGIYVIWDAEDDELFTTENGKTELPFVRT